MSRDTPAASVKTLTKTHPRMSHLTARTNIGLRAVSARLSENIHSDIPGIQPGSSILHVYISHAP